MRAASRLRLFVLALLGAALTAGVALVVSLVAAPAASGAPACTVTWVGAVSTDFNTAANWLPTRVPTGSDVACMSANAITKNVVSAGDQSLRAVLFDVAGSTLTVSGGAFVVSEPGTDASRSVSLTLSGGSLAGAWTTGGLTWNGGSLTGSTTTLTSTGTATASGSANAACVGLLAGATWTSTGSSSWSTSTCGWSVGGGARFVNGSGATWNATGNGTYGMTVPAGTGAVVNSGTASFRTDAQGGTFSVAPGFANTGTVTVTQGSLMLPGGGVGDTPDTGAWNRAVSGSNVIGTAVWAGGSRTATTVSGSGLRMTGGTNTVGGGTLTGIDTTGGTLVIPDGGNLGVSAFAAFGTSTVRGPGTLTTTGNSFIQQSTPVVCLTMDAGVRWVNSGTMTWNVGNCSWTMSGGSQFLNSTGGVLSIFGNAPPGARAITDGGGGTNTIVNNGRASVFLAQPSFYVTIAVPFANLGTTTVTQGSVLLSGGGVADTPDTGSWNSGSGIFMWAGGTRTVQTLSGTGVRITGGSNTVQSGAITRFELAGGTLTIPDGAAVSAQDTGWSGTTLAGPGTLTSTGTSTASGTSPCVQLVDGARWINSGTLTWTGPCGWTLRDDGRFTNTGFFTIYGSSALLSDGGGTGTRSVTNSGVLTVALGNAGAASLNVPVVNSGTVNVVGFRLDTASYTQSAGTTTVAGGAGLTGPGGVSIDGGVLTGSGTVFGTVSGAGTIRPGTNGGGTLSVNGTVRSSAGAPTHLAVTETSSAGTAVQTSGGIDVTGLTLDITTSSAPAVGTVRTVINGTARTGAIGSITGAAVPAFGGYWVVGYTATSVTITFSTSVVSIGNATVNEGDSGTSTATFTVSLDRTPTVPMSVDYATADGTAVAGSDYTATSGTVTFAPGDTSHTVAVSVSGDTLHEAAETFTVNLSNVQNGRLGTAVGTGTIVDDDPAPAVSISPAQVVEGDSGTSPAVFTVSLGTASGLPVSVDVTTADGTAKVGADYTAAARTVTFAPGDTSKNFAVTVLGDTLYEGNETFTATLSNVRGATIGTGVGTGTIVDDDTAPVVSIGDVSVAEGGGTATLGVTLSAPSGRAVTVDYTTADGTAVAGADYTATSGTLTIASGDTGATVTVPVLDDATFEADETFTVRLSDVQGATIGTGVGTGTITDDDTAPTVSVADSTTTIDAGTPGSIGFPVILSARSGLPVTVGYTTVDGTATDPGDYTATSGTLTIPAGQVIRTVTVPLPGPVSPATARAFTLTLSAPTGATLADGTGTGTVTRVGPPDHLVLTPGTASITAGDTQAYTAQAVDSAGNDLGDVTALTVFTVDGGGSCTDAVCGATSAGNHVVTGSYDTGTAKSTAAGTPVVTGTAALSVTPGALDRIQLTPGSGRQTAGERRTFQVLSYDRYGNQIADVTADADLSIDRGSCDATSCVDTVVGRHVVTAGYRGLVTTATFGVLHAALDRIVLVPATTSVVAGRTQTYQVLRADRFGNRGGPATSPVALSIAGGGSCTGTGCMSTVAGDHLVTATSGGQSATARLTVTPAAVFRLIVTPRGGAAVAGDRRAYTVGTRDRYGNAAGDVTGAATFAITDGTCVANACGATKAGQHTVTATYRGLSSTVTLTVTVAAFDHITVVPDAASAAPGQAVVFRAFAYDAYGNSRGGVTSDTVFVIDGGGTCRGNVCSGRVVGTYTVTATYQAHTATATLVVRRG